MKFLNKKTYLLGFVALFAAAAFVGGFSNSAQASLDPCDFVPNLPQCQPEPEETSTTVVVVPENKTSLGSGDWVQEPGYANKDYEYVDGWQEIGNGAKVKWIKDAGRNADCWVVTSPQGTSIDCEVAG